MHQLRFMDQVAKRQIQQRLDLRNGPALESPGIARRYILLAGNPPPGRVAPNGFSTWACLRAGDGPAGNILHDGMVS